MKTAFFDFDGTITRHDTFLLFAYHAVGKKRFFTAFIKALPYIIAWKSRLISNAKAKERLFCLLYRGMSQSEFNDICMSFIPQINNDLRFDTMQHIRWHQKLGHEIVIVSASIGNWIRPWAETHGISTVLATEIETGTDDKLTGKFITPNCHGEEKVKRIIAAIPTVSTRETWAYGDSAGDKAMLSMATHSYKI